MAVSSQTPSGNINAVPEIIKLIRPVDISINATSGNINIVLEIYTYMPSGYLNTTEIEKDMHTPCGHINTVPIHLRPVTISIQFETNIYTFYAQ